MADRWTEALNNPLKKNKTEIFFGLTAFDFGDVFRKDTPGFTDLSLCVEDGFISFFGHFFGQRNVVLQELEYDFKIAPLAILNHSNNEWYETDYRFIEDIYVTSLSKAGITMMNRVLSKTFGLDDVNLTDEFYERVKKQIKTHLIAAGSEAVSTIASTVGANAATKPVARAIKMESRRIPKNMAAKNLRILCLKEGKVAIEGVVGAGFEEAQGRIFPDEDETVFSKVLFREISGKPANATASFALDALEYLPYSGTVLSLANYYWNLYSTVKWIYTWYTEKGNYKKMESAINTKIRLERDSLRRSLRSEIFQNIMSPNWFLLLVKHFRPKLISLISDHYKIPFTKDGLIDYYMRLIYYNSQRSNMLKFMASPPGQTISRIRYEQSQDTNISSSWNRKEQYLYDRGYQINRRIW